MRCQYRGTNGWPVRLGCAVPNDLPGGAFRVPSASDANKATRQRTPPRARLAGKLSNASGAKRTPATSKHCRQKFALGA